MAFSLTKTYGMLPPPPRGSRVWTSATAVPSDDGLWWFVFASNTICNENESALKFITRSGPKIPAAGHLEGEIFLPAATLGAVRSTGGSMFATFEGGEHWNH